MEDLNCSQNLDQDSTLPVKGSSLIGGSFTECVTETMGVVAVGRVVPWILNCAADAERTLSVHLLAF